MYKFILVCICLVASWTLGYSWGVNNTIEEQKIRADKTIAQQTKIIEGQYLTFKQAIENSHKEQYQKEVQRLASAYNDLYKKDIENFNKAWLEQQEQNKKLAVALGMQRYTDIQNNRRIQNELFKQQQVIKSLVTKH